MEYVLGAIQNVFLPINLFAVFVGTFAGIVIGALPGLSTVMGLSILLPFTLSFSGMGGMYMLLVVFCGCIYGGSISASLLNTPGTSASAATALDGYPMANKLGQPGRALGISTLASLFGGLFSAICLCIFAPMLAKVALKFSAQEYFALAVFGISIVAGLTGKSVIKGVIGGVIGLLLATIGIDGRGGGSMGLIALLIAYLLGRGGCGGNGKRKGGWLSRIILLLVILALGYMVVQCVAGDMDGTGGYDGSSDIQLIEAEPTPTPKPQLAQTQAVAADTTVSNLAREKRTQIRGGGQDVYTIMVYMCGTDLESNYGMATSDINEMLHADLSDKVNIIVETGGADKWQNTVISSKVNQIYQIKNEGILRLEADFGKKAMTKAETLTEFIQYCETNFPADSNALIMWAHGGGSNTSYGYDQKFPNGSMTLDVFNKALKDAGCTFDFIGFDACLMATLETAMVAEQYSDYFIASEEPEPGCGWYYTNWLTQLSRNPSMDTVSIGKTIIDDYTAACRQQSSSNQTTLSLVDLAELSGTVPEAFNKFASSTVELIDSDSYTVVSNARSRAKEFSSGINQIDLINFADNMGTPEAKALAEALRGCIKYNRVSKSLANANGISIYFPYRKLSSMNSMVDIYDEIGMDDAYTNCIRSFASVAAGGQLTSSSSGSPLTSLFGDMSGSGNSADMLSELLSAALSGNGSISSGSSFKVYCCKSDGIP